MSNVLGSLGRFIKYGRETGWQAYDNCKLSEVKDASSGRLPNGKAVSKFGVSARLHAVAQSVDKKQSEAAHKLVGAMQKFCSAVDGALFYEICDKSIPAVIKLKLALEDYNKNVQDAGNKLTEDDVALFCKNSSLLFGVQEIPRHLMELIRDCTKLKDVSYINNPDAFAKIKELWSKKDQIRRADWLLSKWHELGTKTPAELAGIVNKAATPNGVNVMIPALKKLAEESPTLFATVIDNLSETSMKNIIPMLQDLATKDPARFASIIGHLSDVGMTKITPLLQDLAIKNPAEFARMIGHLSDVGMTKITQLLQDLAREETPLSFAKVIDHLSAVGMTNITQLLQDLAREETPLSFAKVIDHLSAVGMTKITPLLQDLSLEVLQRLVVHAPQSFAKVIDHLSYVGMTKITKLLQDLAREETPLSFARMIGHLSYVGMTKITRLLQDLAIKNPAEFARMIGHLSAVGMTKITPLLQELATNQAQSLVSILHLLPEECIKNVTHIFQFLATSYPIIFLNYVTDLSVAVQGGIKHNLYDYWNAQATENSQLFARTINALTPDIVCYLTETLQHLAIEKPAEFAGMIGDLSKQGIKNMTTVLKELAIKNPAEFARMIGNLSDVGMTKIHPLLKSLANNNFQSMVIIFHKLELNKVLEIMNMLLSTNTESNSASLLLKINGLLDPSEISNSMHMLQSFAILKSESFAGVLNALSIDKFEALGQMLQELATNNPKSFAGILNELSIDKFKVLEPMLQELATNQPEVFAKVIDNLSDAGLKRLKPMFQALADANPGVVVKVVESLSGDSIPKKLLSSLGELFNCNPAPTKMTNEMVNIMIFLIETVGMNFALQLLNTLVVDQRNSHLAFAIVQELGENTRFVLWYYNYNKLGLEGAEYGCEIDCSRRNPLVVQNGAQSRYVVDVIGRNSDDQSGSVADNGEIRSSLEKMDSTELDVRATYDPGSLGQLERFITDQCIANYHVTVISRHMTLTDDKEKEELLVLGNCARSTQITVSEIPNITTTKCATVTFTYTDPDITIGGPGSIRAPQKSNKIYTVTEQFILAADGYEEYEVDRSKSESFAVKCGFDGYKGIVAVRGDAQVIIKDILF